MQHVSEGKHSVPVVGQGASKRALLSERPGKMAASHAIGFQIAASSLGAAGIPTLAGILAKRFGLDIIGPYLFAVACALLVLHELVVRLAPPVHDDEPP